ncbi:MAG: S8 family peptidase [Patescibacteria group bacterium]|nr:S8 family peptidase [Patescibacteria group bacterium]
MLYENTRNAWFAAARRLEEMMEETNLPFQPGGVTLELQGTPEMDQVLKSLDLTLGAIELNSVKREGETRVVTVFIPDAKMEWFLGKIDAYVRTLETQKKPSNAALIDRIISIKLATLKSMWMDDEGSFPKDGESVWWELWLRDSDLKMVGHMELVAKAAGFKLGNGVLRFQDRLVRLAYGTPEQLSKSIVLLGVITEVRAARQDPEPFLAMSPGHQEEWVEDCVERTTPAPVTAPAVCILDWGVKQGNPLLKSSMSEEDVHTCNVKWGTDDESGHGTAMAGLALYPNLQAHLRGGTSLQLTHRLESVRVLPPKGDPKNEPDICGEVIAKSIQLAEGRLPDRLRVFNHAISDWVRKTLGGPTSYSAALDALAFGSDLLGTGVQGRKRLIVTSTGNRTPPPGSDPIEGPKKDHLHNPAQAWNALTVGGMTNLGGFPHEDFDGCSLFIAPGTFSPSSKTSCMWDQKWPLKPDIVMEAGNALVTSDVKLVDDQISSLSLLTTGIKGPLGYVAMSSAAAAQASELSAAVWAKYPTLWPESVRGLLVHSATWTDQMLAMHPPRTDGINDRVHGQALLRCFGFGVPNRQRALSSLDNGVTILIEDSVQAYNKDHYQDMNLHRIPWPKGALESIHDKTVRLKVTLSYFIEPNPADRGWVHKHRYASFGLRFDMQTSGEDEETFRARMNQAERDEEEGEEMTRPSDSEEWLFGPTIRVKGSLHSDIWEGLAADLLLKGVIGVAPTIGWWRERYQLERWKTPVRYSLLISLEALQEEVDLYEPLLKALVPVTPTIQASA